MRKATFDPDTLPEELRKDWDKLVVKAERAKAALAQDGIDAHRWRNDAWRGFKQFLFDHVFFGMCAYCEAAVEAVYVGDAEHYRPKGKVTQLDKEGAEVVVADAHGNRHPGYYWLAYDWRNILPSCRKCNTDDGKGTQFPAIKHAFSPADADCPATLDEFEEPFLLQPFRDGYDPKSFFIFDDLGGIEPRNENKQAEASIQVYDLKRGALRDRRLEAYKLAWQFFRESREDAIRNGKTLAGIMKDYEEGRKPHSAAALLYVGRMIATEERANAEAMGREPAGASADGHD